MVVLNPPTMTTAFEHRALTLNVGGKRYTVSSHLILADHPDSLLACTVANALSVFGKDQENDGSSTVATAFDEDPAIFIDGNPDRFEYCLDYIIKGRAILPAGVSKMAVLDDLKYYGINVPSEDCIKVDTSDITSNTSLSTPSPADQIVVHHQQQQVDNSLKPKTPTVLFDYLDRSCPELTDMTTLMMLLARLCAYRAKFINSFELTLDDDSSPFTGNFKEFRNKIVRYPYKLEFDRYLELYGFQLEQVSNFRSDCVIRFGPKLD